MNIIKGVRGFQCIKEPLADRFWRKVEKTESCWLWKGYRNPRGYGYIGVGSHGETNSTHRVSWEINRGPIPKGKYVLHRCDNPPCVRPDHLFIGSQFDNVHDMLAKGRGNHIGPRGELAPSAKLTKTKVLEIRRRYAEGEKHQGSLAKEFGVRQQAISKIVTRVRWKHI